jgi:plasmid stability protein
MHQRNHTPDGVASITIRNLDEALKGLLRIRAAQHGRSMEEEARDILRIALSESKAPAKDLATTIRDRFAPFGGVDLPELSRPPIRTSPELDR